MTRKQLIPVTLLALTGLAAATSAQPIEPVAPEDRAPSSPDTTPDPSADRPQAVLDRVNAAFLTPIERARLRVEHGLWTTQDLEEPRLAAPIALNAGAITHPSLRAAPAPIALRAKALLDQGRARDAIALIDSDDAPDPDHEILRTRTLASAHELLGDTRRALELLERIETMLATPQGRRADELAHGALAMMDLVRLRGPGDDARAAYESINALLAFARENVDPLSWRVRAAEARLLYAHHNLQEASDAAIEALRLNPRALDPALVLAEIAVDAFDLDRAERLAKRIDLLSRLVPGISERAPAPATIHGASIRARIALRRRDPEGAEAALDPALASFPDHPRLLALEASAAAAGYRMSSTERLLERFDERYPGSPLALVRVGETLAEARQYDDAREILRRAIERAPNWGEPRLQLGLLLVQAARDDEARGVLGDAVALDPFNARANNSLTLLESLAAYETIETEHFVIRYLPGVDEVLAREMPDVLERIHERVTGDTPGGMDHEPDRKTIIELMPDHETFAVRIGGMPSIHTMAASTGPIIAIEAPKSGPGSKIGPYHWERVLQHEYTHTANLARTSNRVIHWMTEANAVYNEDAPRGAPQWTLLANAFVSGELFDLDEINTAFVRPEKPTDRSLAYAQGAWMYEYLVERFGTTAPRDIMDASASGRSAPEAFESVLGISRDAFKQGFLGWARQQLIDRGLAPSADAPVLTELLEGRETSPSVIDELLTEYPEHPELLTLKAAALTNSADPVLTDDQLDAALAALGARPDNDPLRKRVTRHYLSLETFEARVAAIEHLEYLCEREIHNPAYADQLAIMHAQLGDNTKALEYANLATRIAPYDAPAREQAARMALIAGDEDAARTHLEALADLEPDRAIHTRRLEALNERTVP